MKRVLGILLVFVIMFNSLSVEAGLFRSKKNKNQQIESVETIDNTNTQQTPSKSKRKKKNEKNKYKKQQETVDTNKSTDVSTENDKNTSTNKARKEQTEPATNMPETAVEETSPLYNEYHIPKDVVLYSKSSRSVNAIDPSMSTSQKNSYYPGFRGTNQLIIYTPAYGDKTNTNEFGAEAIVKDNIVVAMSGADSLIPKNGVVISGHGSAKNWINKNIIVGTRIYIDRDKNSVTAYTTSESFIYGAKECLNEVQEVMKFYKSEDEYYNSKNIDDCIKSAQNCIKKAENNPTHVQEYSQLAIEYANKALSMAVPYKATEIRGVWIRPACKTREDVVYIVSRLADAGINNIFLETYFHGMTIFPSKTMVKYGFVEENPVFGDFDVLRAFMEECRKRNIKVNIWFETFYTGNKHPDSNKQSILSVCPTWSNMTKKSYDADKPEKCASEHNGYFLDPSNPEVQTFLLQLVCEIIYSYRPDGINMDYIRYPQSNAPKNAGSDGSAWGYTCYARNEFKSIYGVDPVLITPCDNYWQAWCDYRRDKVTSFVKRISKICRSNNVNLTAVIFPNRYSALENKHQDWVIWSKNNYIDGFTPLFLTCDPETAADLMRGVIKYKDPKTKLYAGLFVAFMNGAQSDLVRQIHETRKLKIDGFSIFDYAHFQDIYINTLKESICTKPPEPKRVKTNPKSKKKRVRKN
ncbi:MAG: family 10 glycosylhydrolase [Candidatus Gastranaerophilales bacterium]|nr:family 10 glycosylhydrolase [Candidatus Gastranaerophilales bacterium]